MRGDRRTDKDIIFRAMLKLISVIIPTYNRASMLPRAIESVLEQDYPSSEIIIVDDCSEDDTEAVVRQYRDPRIVYLRLPQNCGVAAARNEGLKRAKGELIAFLDSDDEFLPGKLSRQAKIFESVTPQPHLVITNYWMKGETRELVVPQAKASGFVQSGEKFPADVFDGPPSWMLTRECVRQNGFFDEKLRTLEDLDYFARIVRSGPVYFLNEPLSLIHVHSYPAGRAPDVYVEETRCRILEKWFPEMRRDRRFLSDFYYVAGKDLVRIGESAKAIRWLWRAFTVDWRNSRVLRKLLEAAIRRLFKPFNFLSGGAKGRFKVYRSILLINPYGIGDVLFSTPLIRNLHEAFSDAKIYYLSNKRTAMILKHHPFIRNVFIYDRDDFAHARQKSFWMWVRKNFDLLMSIRREKIELALDLSLNSFFGILSFAAGIRQRVGLHYHQRGRFLTKSWFWKDLTRNMSRSIIWIYCN